MDTAEPDLQRRLVMLSQVRQPPSGLTIVAFSNDLDRLLAAFMLANGAAAMGMPVAMFFTFWALTALKRKTVLRGKPFLEKLLAAALPSGPHRLGPSRWRLLGLGRRLFGALMQRHRVENLPALIALSRELNVRLVACETSMKVLALTKEELIDGVESGGVATCLDAAQNGAITLFV